MKAGAERLLRNKVKNNEESIERTTQTEKRNQYLIPDVVSTVTENALEFSKTIREGVLAFRFFRNLIRSSEKLQLHIQFIFTFSE